MDDKPETKEKIAMPVFGDTLSVAANLVILAHWEREVLGAIAKMLGDGIKKLVGTITEQGNATRDVLKKFLASMVEMSAKQDAMDAKLDELIQNVDLALAAKLAEPPADDESDRHASDGDVVEFIAEAIVVTMNEEGKPAYKVKGGRFVKFGVRVWPEILTASTEQGGLGVDPDKLRPGPNPFTLRVRALTDPETGKPKKIVGLVK